MDRGIIIIILLSTTVLCQRKLRRMIIGYVMIIIVIVNVFPPQLTQILHDDATFLCWYFDNYETIINIHWLVNGSLLESLDLKNAFTHFDDGTGELLLTDLDIKYNNTRIRCEVEFSSGRFSVSSSALLSVQGKDCTFHRQRNLAPVLLQQRGASPPFKTDVIILCTEFYHLGEGAHFASCYMKIWATVSPPYLKSSSSAYAFK